MKVDKMKIGDISLPKKSFKWTEENSAHNYLYIDLSSVDRITKTITEHIVVNASNAPSRAKQIVSTGDILFGTTRPLLKRSCIVDEKYDGQLCSTGFCVIRPNRNKVNTKWLHFALCANRFYEYIKPLQRGISYPAVSDKDVYNYILSFPCLAEQQTIASELEAVQEMIDGYKAQIADLDALAQSIFLDMFGDPISNPKKWEKFPLKELAITMSTGPFGSMLHKEDYDIEGVPSINPQDIKGNQITIENIALVNRNKAKELNRYILHTNDIVIARRGDLSKCAIISQNENGWLCGTGSFFLSLKDLMPILFYYFYTSKSVQKYLNDKCIGATMPNLNQGILSSLMLPLPPFALQKCFATQVEAIEKQKELIRQQLADAETLMEERMQYYFS